MRLALQLTLFSYPDISVASVVPPVPSILVFYLCLSPTKILANSQQQCLMHAQSPFCSHLPTILAIRVSSTVPYLCVLFPCTARRHEQLACTYSLPTDLVFYFPFRQHGCSVFALPPGIIHTCVYACTSVMVCLSSRVACLRAPTYCLLCPGKFSTHMYACQPKWL